MIDIAKAAANCACDACKEFDARPISFLPEAVVVHYELGYSALFDLRQAWLQHGGSDAELAAIDHLERGVAERVDVERLAGLAKLAGLPWKELFPDVIAEPVAHSANDFYPPNWPRCPHCGDHALDGHITCGRVGCREHGASL